MADLRADIQNALTYIEENLTEELEIRDIANFAKTLKGVTEMHILPYHRLGADKYAGLGRNYELDGVLPPTDEHMEMLKSVAESVGIKCQIGG